MESDDGQCKGRPAVQATDTLFATNFYKIITNNPLYTISVYQCSLSHKEDRHRALSNYKITRQILEDHFNSQTFIFSNGLLYTPLQVPTEIQSLRYTTRLLLHLIGTLDEPTKVMRFLQRYVERIFYSMKLVSIDGKFYDQHKISHINEFGINVINGFHHTIVNTENGFALLLDIAYKVIKTDSVYDYIKKTYTCEADYTKIKNELLGKSVITKYNNRLYTIKDIDFIKKPKSEMINVNGTQYTFKEYYLSKYSVSYTYDNQPLLATRSRNNTITYLLPELCYIIGISDEMLKDFKLLKLVYSFYKEPGEYLQQSHSIIKKINDSSITKSWNISFATNGNIVKGTKLNAGNLILRNSKVPIDTIQSFERELQKGMIASPSLNMWGILYSIKHKSAKDSLLNEIQSIVTVLQIPCKLPRLVEIANDEFSTWIDSISHIPPNVEALIILIPGNKNVKSSLYLNLKVHFLMHKSIPTQFLMASTIERGKNLKSICYKVVTQLCTKLGGIPWEIDPLQFTDRPLMILGISSEFTKSLHITALCGTLDKKLSRYTACTVASRSAIRIHDKLLQMLSTFKLTVGDYPHHIIIYREGSLECKKNKLAYKEMNDLVKVFKTIGKDISFTLVFVDRKTPVKQYIIKKQQDRVDIKVPTPGCIINSSITSKDTLEFYLTSCKSNNKAPPLTHYQLAYVDHIAEDMSRKQYFRRLQDLTFKLCYLYYNNSGSINIPAPLKYAIRLRKLISELSTNEILVPKEHYEVTNGLYFI